MQQGSSANPPEAGPPQDGAPLAAVNVKVDAPREPGLGPRIPHVSSRPHDLSALAASKERADRTQLLEIAGETNNGQDNSRFMQKLADRLHRVNVTFPSVEVRWNNLTVDLDVPDGGNRVTTLASAFRDAVRGAVGPYIGSDLHLKRRVILNNVSGVLRPGRMTLLLGPPGSGKTTLMKALAGQLKASNPMVRMTHDAVTYNGLLPGKEFVIERTAAFVSQIDTHIPELTVAETMTFASANMGPGNMKELFDEVRRREAKEGIKPDPAIEAGMMASENGRTSIIVEYFARLLGIDHVLDTVVGDDLLKGISGGQKRRVTIGEMAVGLLQVLFLDEISNGLDSSATLAISKALRNMCTFGNATLLVSLLQPAPEVYDCFDDIMVMSHGRIVFQGPREEVVPFFSSLNFSVPINKTVADFLQEVTNQSDQHRFWSREDEPWQWTPPLKIKEAYEQSPPGQDLQKRLQAPPHSHEMQHMVLMTTPYALPFWMMLGQNLKREWLLMRRNKVTVAASVMQSLITAFLASTTFLKLGKSTQQDANMYLSIIFFSLTSFVMGGFNFVPIFCKRLPVFFKQRDQHFYTGSMYAISVSIMRLPDAILTSACFAIMVYFSVGFYVSAGQFFIFWLGLLSCAIFSNAMFLAMGAILRNDVMSQGLGAVAFMFMVAASGFIMARSSMPGWWIWIFWSTPMSYVIRSLSINELMSPDWDASSVPYGGQPGEPLGEFSLEYRGIYTAWMWVWIGIGAEFAFALLFSIVQALALNYLSAPAGQKPAPPHDGEDDYTEEELKPVKKSKSTGMELNNAGGSPKHATTINMAQLQPVAGAAVTGDALTPKAGPAFQLVTLAFKDICYFVPKPKGEGELQLLNNVSGSFRPGVLTALMGASGAGKTTLMDVLAGRKTAGHMTGQELINGFPKKMNAFARVMGYVEQFDVHTPQATVLESVIFSARLRLKGANEMTKPELRAIIDDIMEVVELGPIAGAVVGMPGSGLSTEGRKRLTIAVELVASPSLVFMDEPTSGLDARAASVVMRATRNIVRTGRTVVCTIHQPNRQIFEAFDELLLLKPGGRIIFNGPLGEGASNLVSYFEAIPGVPSYDPSFNPANWMLDVSNTAVEKRMGTDFAEIWKGTEQCRLTAAVVEKACAPTLAIAADAEAGVAEQEGSSELVSRMNEVSYMKQFQLLLWRSLQVHWRNPSYNLLRFLLTIAMGLMFGSLFWGSGMDRSTLLGVLNILGALFAATLFMGIANNLIVMPVIFTARTVFYREKASRMYNPIIFAMAQGTAEIPFLAVQAVIYSVIVYYMIQFEFTATKFCWFLLINLLNLSIFTYLGIGMMNLTPNVTISTSLMSLLIMLWDLFCGFLQPKNEIRKWWIWAYYWNPITWAIYGLVVSQLGDVTDEYIDVGQGQMMSVSQYIEEAYSYEYSFRGWVVFILVGFLIAGRVMALVGLRFCNFQTR